MTLDKALMRSNGLVSGSLGARFSINGSCNAASRYERLYSGWSRRANFSAFKRPQREESVTAASSGRCWDRMLLLLSAHYGRIVLAQVQAGRLPAAMLQCAGSNMIIYQYSKARSQGMPSLRHAQVDNMVGMAGDSKGGKGFQSPSCISGLSALYRLAGGGHVTGSTKQLFHDLVEQLKAARWVDRFTCNSSTESRIC